MGVKNRSRQIIFILIISIIFCSGHFHAISAENCDSLDLAIAEQLIQIAIEKFESINDYTAIIISTEQINGKLRDTEYIQTKFKKPGNVYLKWLPGPFSDNQASYVPYRDGENSFRAKETGLTGLLGVTKWEMDSPVIKLLYPHHFSIRNTHLQFFMDVSQQLIEKGQKGNLIQLEEVCEVYDELLQSYATKITILLSENPNDELMWLKIELYFEKVTQLPLHFKLFDFDGGLYGEYGFTQFQENIGLNDKDFDLK